MVISMIETQRRLCAERRLITLRMRTWEKGSRYIFLFLLNHGVVQWCRSRSEQTATISALKVPVIVITSYTHAHHVHESSIGQS